MIAELGPSTHPGGDAGHGKPAGFPCGERAALALRVRVLPTPWPSAGNRCAIPTSPPQMPSAANGITHTIQRGGQKSRRGGRGYDKAGP